MFLQPDLPKATSESANTATTTAAPGPAAAPGAGAAGPFGPMGMMFLQWRRQRSEDAGRKQLKRGDRVVLQAGILGELVEAGDKVMKVKVGGGTVLEVLAHTVTAVNATTDAKAADPLADLRDSKAQAEKK